MRQDCTTFYIACYAVIPDREKHSCHHPTTALSRSRPEWLLNVLYSENGPQGDAFLNHGGHQIECYGRTPKDFKRSPPAVLPTMTGSMEQVCACARVLLWRWLGKRCHMSYHYSAIAQFRELFDCPSYDAGNFSKIRSASGQHEIQHTDWRIKILFTIIYNFICVVIWVQRAIRIYWSNKKKLIQNTAIPRLTKIIRSGSHSLAETWFPVGFYRKSFNSFWMLPTI